MKKGFVFLNLMVCLLLTNPQLIAQTVDVKEAEQVALNFLSRKSTNGAAKNLTTLTNVKIEKEEDEIVCYIFQVNQKGFIIISADKNAPAILAYGEEGASELNQRNESFHFWLRDLKKEILDLKKDKNNKIADYSNEWLNLSKETKHQITAKNGTPVVGPLTTTQWGQSGYYNDLTPPDGNTCPAGCVAIGMAQAFKYYNHPVKGKNTILSYTHNTTVAPNNTPLSYGTLTADLGNTTYNWNNMPNVLQEANNDLATLIYHAGVSVKMNYKPIPNSSNAYYSDLAFSLKNSFAYTSSGALYKYNYTPSAWLNMIKSDLNDSLIVIMCGNDFTLNAGHCFIVDGYDDQDFLHINWGWNGSYNGYFLATNISVRDYNFNGNNHIYRIYPTCYSELNVSNISYNAATITNTEYAQTNYFQYRKAGSIDWTTIATTASLLTITDLSPATLYEYRDSIICSELGKVVSPIKKFTTAPLPSYCASQGKIIAYEWVKSVSIGTINNVSGKNNGYGNFTHLATDAVKGKFINYTFTPGYSSQMYPERWMIWVDFNQDGDFNDSSELVLSENPVSGTINGSFTIPPNARIGNTRIRVAMSYYAHSNPCSNPSYGEVEDYTINITNESKNTIATNENKKADTDPITSFLIYPNPSSGKVYLEIEGVKKDVVISVKNMLGQSCFRKDISPATIKITEYLDVSDLPSGMYLVELLTNEKIITHHLILK